MRPRRPLYRNAATAVYGAVFNERVGKGWVLTTVYEAWCEEDACQDRGCLGSFRDRGKAIRLASGHRHRLIPGYHRARGGRWRRAA
jgi:hypothetical protein